MEYPPSNTVAETGPFAGRPLTAHLRSTPLEITCAPGALLDALALQDGAVMLDSSARHEEFGRYTVLACRPIEVLTLCGKRLADRSGTVLAEGNEAFWRALARAFEAVRLADAPAREGEDTYVSHTAPAAPVFCGWIGYVGYEVGRRVERLPARAQRDTPLPDLRLGFYDAVLVCDGVEGTWHLAELIFDSPPPGAGRAAEALGAVVRHAQADVAHRPPAAANDDAARRPLARDAQSNFPPDQYRAAVGRCVNYIAAGDIFQVNLSQRFTVSPAPAPLAIYDALRRRNPAWFAAYMAFQADGQNCTILSSSPELFLRLDGRRVTTRPIKGTRPRLGCDADDRAAADDLLASAKDNAELAMIIDLLRNDLGRVCSYGTVRVVEPRRLETHPTVYHLVGTVTGELHTDVGPAELLRATFPGGSITGAPKIRAMEIIDEIEPVARGVYTGCVGYVAVDGSCQWNIAIRTIVTHGDRALVQVGGGIVADSVPDGEYNETLDKARALLEAIALARENTKTPTT